MDCSLAPAIHSCTGARVHLVEVRACENLHVSTICPAFGATDWTDVIIGYLDPGRFMLRRRVDDLWAGFLSTLWAPVGDDVSRWRPLPGNDHAARSTHGMTVRECCHLVKTTGGRHLIPRRAPRNPSAAGWRL